MSRGSEPTAEGFGRAAGTSLLGSLPMPLPENYVRGIDAVVGHRPLRLPTCLRGELRPGGWWCYYPYALAIKMPLGTLALLGLACVYHVDCSEANRVRKQLGLRLLQCGDSSPVRDPHESGARRH